MNYNEMKFAVLIDGDNIAPKYLKSILDEVADNGVATFKRAYSDWTSTSRAGWKKILLENSVMPVQQYSYTTGKNATDSAMIIDAMDILYTGNVDGFYLVTSDSDFTRLAARLREAGKFVVGVGEAKTPSAFRSACNSFKLLEVLANEDVSIGSSQDKSATDRKRTARPDKKEDTVEIFTSIKEIEKAVYKIIDDNSNQGKDTYIGEVGNKLMNKFPDFDVRNYGCTKLSTFLEDKLRNLVLQKKNTNTVVSIQKAEFSKQDLEEQITKILVEYNGQCSNMAAINERLKQWSSNFSFKKMGYSKFAFFLMSFPDLVEVNKNTVVLKSMKAQVEAAAKPAVSEAGTPVAADPVSTETVAVDTVAVDTPVEGSFAPESEVSEQQTIKADAKNAEPVVTEAADTDSKNAEPAVSEVSSNDTKTEESALPEYVSPESASAESDASESDTPVKATASGRKKSSKSAQESKKIAPAKAAKKNTKKSTESADESKKKTTTRKKAGENDASESVETEKKPRTRGRKKATSSDVASKVASDKEEQ